jgi:hypothetical protein
MLWRHESSNSTVGFCGVYECNYQTYLERRDQELAAEADQFATFDKN